MIKKLALIFLLLFSTAYAVEISVDETLSRGLWYNAGDGQYKIIPDCEFGLAIRYDNSDGVLELAVQGGFEVYIDNDQNGIPDIGTSFTPVSWSANNDYTWIGSGGFFMIFDSMLISNDGADADTIVNYGISFNNEIGLPAGFNDIAIYIESGAVEEGSTFCIDSAWFPPAGYWRWQSGVQPIWAGPFCFESLDPGVIIPTISNIPSDTLIYNYCGTASYDFNTFDGNAKFILNSSIGKLNETTGVWSYKLSSNPSVFNLNFTVYKVAPCLGTNYIVPVKNNFIESHETSDLNQDCSTDIADIMYYVDYILNDGPAPGLMVLADCNNTDEIDIADLVYLVDYFFNGGPIPYNPWE